MREVLAVSGCVRLPYPAQTRILSPLRLQICLRFPWQLKLRWVCCVRGGFSGAWAGNEKSATGALFHKLAERVGVSRTSFISLIYISFFGVFLGACTQCCDWVLSAKQH